MRILIPLGIVVFSALICGLFQLSLGSLLLLYHSSLGRHIRKKTKSLASSFIAGVCLMIFLLLATSCFINIALINGNAELSSNDIFFFSISIGILCSTAIVIWFFYYRSGRSKRDSTELWLPKPISHFISSRASTTNNNSEAFALGLLTALGEIPFTFILFILAGNAILELTESYETIALSLFSIASVLPLLILRWMIRSGKTVVEIQRWRVRNKTFFRIFTGFCFVVLAIFIFTFKILGVAL